MSCLSPAVTSPHPFAAGEHERSEVMMYRLNPNLFVENGAAALAERTRAARLAIHEHELARKRDSSTEPQPLPCLAA